MPPSEWKRITLGEFVRLQRGYDLPSAARRDGVIPILGSAGISGSHSEAAATGPGVTIGRSGVGSMGVVSYSPVDYWPHNTTLFVTDFLGNDARFAFYLLQTIDFRSYNSGSAQASLNRNNIYPIQIDVPLPVEQRAIATVLASLDDKIDLNRRMNATLEAMVRALFQAWFVDFEPVRAKAEGAMSFPLMPKELFDALPNRLTHSDLGPIPEGWQVTKFHDIAVITRDSINPSAFPDEFFDHYSIPAFDERRMASPERGDAIRSNKFIIGPDAVLLAKLNPRIQRIWLPVIVGGRRSVCSTEFIVLSPRSRLSRAYLGALVASNPFQDVFPNLATGTTGSHQRVKPDSVMALNVLSPPDRLVQRFTDIATPMQTMVAAKIRESATLSETRDALLPRLISGEVRVRP